MESEGYIPVPINERFLSYVLDLVILLSLATLISGAFNAEPVIYKICVYYLYGHHAILKQLTSTNGLIFIGIYIVFSAIYFTFESYFGVSIGKYILGMRTAMIKGNNRNRTLRSITRALIKVVPAIVIVDALFAFKRRLRQRYSDRILEFVVVREKNVEINWINYLLLTLVFYYLPLFTMSTFVYAYHFGNIVPPPAPGSGEFVKPSQSQFNLIFLNNFSIDYTYYMVGGGFTLLFMSVLQLFGGALITGKLLGDSLLTYPSFIVYGTLPHFFIETFGYVFGIMSGVEISRLIIGVIEGYFEGKEVKDLTQMLILRGKYILIFAVLSILLLLIAAWVETYVTSWILNHYYF